MIKIKQAVIVEGKYDKIKLSGIIDAPIIQTDGFGIFKDKELQKLIKKKETISLQQRLNTMRFFTQVNILKRMVMK